MMSLFGSIIGGGLSLLGSGLARSRREEGAEAALRAARPINVRGPGGSAMFSDGSFNLALSPQLERFQTDLGAAAEGVLGDLSGIDFLGRERAELERLRTIRQPEIDQARTALQQRLVQRGRLGLGTGGGRSGRLFQPEVAALEEAILRADLGDIGAARSMSQQEQSFLLGQLQGLSGIQQQVLSGPERLAAIGIGAAPPAAVSALQAQPAFGQARFFEDFFSALGGRIGQPGGLSGLFS